MSLINSSVKKERNKHPMTSMYDNETESSNSV